MVDWSKLWNEIITMEPGMIEICLRLACAMLVGLVIGTEREYTHRPPGRAGHHRRGLFGRRHHYA